MNFKFFSIPVIVIAILTVWGLSILFSNTPPAPEVIYAEFPFFLEYVYQGNKHVVNDSLICEFDGYGFNEGTGSKFRKWKAKLNSGKDRITLLVSDDKEIYYFPIDSRLAGIYMGDRQFYTGGQGNTFPNAWISAHPREKQTTGYIITAKDMKEQYSLELINWHISKPILNSFGDGTQEPFGDVHFLVSFS